MNSLYELRIKHNLLQTHLASILNIAINTYSQYENGKRHIPDDIKIKVADFYNVSIDYILGRTNERNLKMTDSLYIPIEIYEGLKNLSQEEINEVCNYIGYIQNRKK